MVSSKTHFPLEVHIELLRRHWLYIDLDVVGANVSAVIESMIDDLELTRNCNNALFQVWRLFEGDDGLISEATRLAGMRFDANDPSSKMAEATVPLYKIMPDDLPPLHDWLRQARNAMIHSRYQASIWDIHVALYVVIKYLDWLRCKWEKGPQCATSLYLDSAGSKELPKNLQTLLGDIQAGIGTLKIPTTVRSPVADSSSGCPSPVAIQYVPRTLNFKGRLIELKRLRQLVVDEDHLVTCVAGMGGIGKTTLVNRFCEEIAECIRMGRVLEPGRAVPRCLVYVVVKGPDADDFLIDVLQGLERAFGTDGLVDSWLGKGVKVDKKIASILGQLIRLSGLFGPFEEVFVVIDNFECLLDAESGQLVDGALKKLITGIISSIGRFRFIVTSRVEIVLPPPTDVAVQHFFMEEGLAPEHGADLLRSHDHDGRLGLRDAPDGLLREASVRAHGHPFALEALVHCLRVGRGLRLDAVLNDPSMLSEATRSDVGRKLTDQLFRHLDSEAVRILQAMSVFQEEVNLEAIRAVLPEEERRMDIEKGLGVLLKSSILSTAQMEDGVDGQWRDIEYQISHQIYHERAYALLSSCESEKGGTVAPYHRRAAAWLQTQTKPSDVWRSRVDVRHQLRAIDHLQRAKDFNAANRLFNEIDIDYLQKWGHAAESVAIRLEHHHHLDDPGLIAENLAGLGAAFISLGKYSDARRVLEEAVEIGRRHGDSESLSISLNRLGYVLEEFGDIEGALGHWNEAITLIRSVGNPELYYRFLGNLGYALHAVGKLDESLETYQEAVRGEERCGDSFGAMCEHDNLGTLYLDLGKYDEANEHLLRAIALAEQENDFEQLTTFQTNLGWLALARHDFKTAGDSFHSVLRDAIPMGLATEVALASFGRGVMSHDQKASSPKKLMRHRKRIEQLYEKALFQNIDQVSYRVEYRLGVLSLGVGERESANSRFTRCVMMCDSFLERSPMLWRQRYIRALANAGLGQSVAASKDLEAAVRICSAEGVLTRIRLEIDVLEMAGVSGTMTLREILQSRSREQGE
ncbi:MAG: tetratricopeptide repeat protein [Deltaproteobacteria bacterium]|nr:tetratricopeptide repeat protein [Deltaproteobacteria bacterium]